MSNFSHASSAPFSSRFSIFGRRTQWRFWRLKVTRSPNWRKQTQCLHRTRRPAGMTAYAVTIVVRNSRSHCANITVAIVAKYSALNARRRRARCQNSASRRKFVFAMCVSHRCINQRLVLPTSVLVMDQTICRRNIWTARWRNNRK